MIKTFIKTTAYSISRVFIAFLLVSLFSFRSAENFGQILDDYKMDELKYFSEVAFFTGKLSRWTEPIRISQEGNSKEDTAFMNELINELKPLLSGIPISIVPSGGNLVIHNSRTVSKYSRNYSGSESLPLGYAIPRFSEGNNLVHADIYIHPSLLDDKRKEVLVHEICHTLGLLDHPSSTFMDENIMSAAVYKNKRSTLSIPRLDKAAIKLLYDRRMPVNLVKADFLKKLSLLPVSKT